MTRLRQQLPQLHVDAAEQLQLQRSSEAFDGVEETRLTAMEGKSRLQEVRQYLQQSGPLSFAVSDALTTLQAAIQSKIHLRQASLFDVFRPIHSPE